MTLEWISQIAPETWITGAALLVAAAALYFTGISAKAAKDQTEIQKQLRRDAAQPYIWADIRGNGDQGGGLDLVIGNSGPTVATNVRVKIVPPLPVTSIPPDYTEAAFTRLQEGIQALPPGREMIWSIGHGGSIMAAEADHAHTFTIDGTGPFGPIEPLSYVIDIGDFITTDDRPEGSLHQVRVGLDAVAKALSKR